MQGYEQEALGENRNRHVATILVVDDKPTNIKLLFDALKDTGYRTLAAIDGERAVRQAQLGRPDLILMDVMMPGLNGFEACRRLKSIPATRHIPVIFMTALHETADKIKGFEAGGVDFLTKPLVHEQVFFVPSRWVAEFVKPDWGRFMYFLPIGVTDITLERWDILQGYITGNDDAIKWASNWPEESLVKWGKSCQSNAPTEKSAARSSLCFLLPVM